MKKARSILISILLISLICGFFLTIDINYPTKVQNMADQNGKLSISAEHNSALWNTTWGGSGSDQGHGIALDSSGNLYCVGEVLGFGAGSSDLALVKFYPTGSRAWNKTWGGTNNDYGYGVAVDTAGSIICIGSTMSFGAGSSDLALVKFYPNGTRMWNTTWGGSASDAGYGVAVDTAGNIFCVGNTFSFGAGSSDLALVKFYPNGTRAWNTTWGGTYIDICYGVALDTASNLYCVGRTTDSGNTANLIFIKYYPNGTQAWNTTAGSIGNDETYYAVTLDTAGNIYCAGDTGNFGQGNWDFLLLKYYPNGTIAWSRTWGGVNRDNCRGVAVDTAGNIYCAGSTENFGAGSYDLALVKFYPNGNQMWNTTWGGSGEDSGSGIVLDTVGNIYCIGYTFSFGIGGSDFALVKFGVPEPPGGIPGFGLVPLFMALLAILMINLLAKLTNRMKNPKF